MRQRKVRLVRLLALLLTAALILPLSGRLTVTEASAKTLQQEIDALKADAAKLANEKKDIAAQLKSIRNDKSKAMEQKDLILEQINLIQSEIDNIGGQIAALDAMIGEKSQEVAETEVREQEQYELFCQRIRQMEEEGQTSYWAILFDSSDFSDLLDRFMMIEEIIQYDNGVMDSLIALQAELEGQRADLEDSKAEREAARQVQEAARQEQKEREAEVDALIEEIKGKEDELEAAEAALRKAAAAADAAIRQKELELAAQIAKVDAESGFLWPLAGYDTLSSLYGSRKDPFTGKPGNHTGIDIPAPKGVAVLAAKSGVVTTSVRGSGGSWAYGNYVVVSHSDGTSTLYAHLNVRSVKEGQTVKQGQKVGEVGTTGRSTGNHLHFEVRVNGKRTDPVDFFKGKTLYYSSTNGKTTLKH